MLINLFDRVDPMPVPASLRKALATCDFPGGGGARLTRSLTDLYHSDLGEYTSAFIQHVPYHGE